MSYSRWMREARHAATDHSERHSLRGERSRPLLEAMKKEMKAARAAVLPTSALGKAVNYKLSLWEKLTRFLEYPELELSNSPLRDVGNEIVLDDAAIANELFKNHT